MGTTIDNSIKYLTAMRKTYQVDTEIVSIAIDTMCKYQKIVEILNSASYTENGTVYSYTYDEDTRVKHIRKVLEDGKNS